MRPTSGIELVARVAVNTGPVVVPDGDAPAHELYNALGDTVNVAARLQTLGDLVVGPATARQVEALFELDDLGEQELKGKSEPVAAFRVVGTGRRATPRPEPPLVGRARELELLDGALDGLLEGHGAVVSITGEPGIGKSRLVAEAEQRFAGRVRFLAGHAVAYAESIPYWPVRELLRDWLGLGVSEPEARVRLELRTELARALPGDAEDAYPFLAQLLGLALEPANEARIRDLAGDAVQHETFYWLDRLVGALARERPLCFVLDDLHWSDEATLALLDELLPAVEETAVAFVLIHRSDPDHPAWQLVDRARRRFRSSFTELDVEPLAEAETRRARRGGRGRRPAGRARAGTRRARRRQSVLRRRGRPGPARARRPGRGGRPPGARGRDRDPGGATGGAPGASRPARRGGACGDHDRRGDRALVRAAAARAPAAEDAAAVDAVGAAVAPARRRGARRARARVPLPSRAGAGGRLRDADGERPPRAPPAASPRRSWSSTATRRRRSTGCSATTSPRPTSPSAPSSTCSRRAMPPGPSTRRRRRSPSTGARSASWSGRATTSAPARRCSGSRSRTISPSTTPRRTTRSPRRSPDRPRRPRAWSRRSASPGRSRRQEPSVVIPALAYSGPTLVHRPEPVPRAALACPRPRHRARPGRALQRLGRRALVPVHAPPGRTLERRSPRSPPTTSRSRTPGWPRKRMPRWLKVLDGVTAHAIDAVDARDSPRPAAQSLPLRARLTGARRLATAHLRARRARLASHRAAGRQWPVRAREPRRQTPGARRQLRRGTARAGTSARCASARGVVGGRRTQVA